MTLDELLAALDHKSPPAPMNVLERFEATIGQRLPDDYREFLVRCNGGYGCGYVQFHGPTPKGHAADACVNHVGGFRKESYFSLESSYDNYQKHEVRIPKELVWIADDPFGNAICLGISSAHRGRVFFWDHENEPDPDEWDGRVETAGNIDLLANSFTEFMAGLKKVDQ
jgi:SMI1-KNR4 cell-wall